MQCPRLKRVIGATAVVALLSTPLPAQVPKASDPDIIFRDLRGRVAHIDINETLCQMGDIPTSFLCSATFLNNGSIDSWSFPGWRSFLQTSSDTIIHGRRIRFSRRIVYEDFSYDVITLADSAHSFIHSITSRLEYDSIGRPATAAILDSILVDRRQPRYSHPIIGPDEHGEFHRSKTDSNLVDVPEGIRLVDVITQTFFYPTDDSSRMPVVVFVRSHGRDHSITVSQMRDGLKFYSGGTTREFDCYGALLKEVVDEGHPLWTKKFLSDSHANPVRTIRIDNTRDWKPDPDDTTWYQYIYDDHGNWIERIELHRPWQPSESDPTAPIGVTQIDRRTITYYSPEQAPDYVESRRPLIFWTVGSHW